MTTETIKCLFCTADIEADSCHCDQCGKEIFVCSICGKPGDQKFCVFDGSDLISAKQKNGIASVTQTISPPYTYVPPQQFINPPIAPVTVKLTLTNNSIGIVVEIQPNTILGRNTGPYVNLFQTYSAVSGKHLMFAYDVSTGWSFQDLGSTNGTKYNLSNLHWDNVNKCQPNTPITVADNSYILIANIEFVVSLKYPVSQNLIHTAQGTQRI